MRNETGTAISSAEVVPGQPPVPRAAVPPAAARSTSRVR